jgi:hypothetical protein
MQFRPLTYALGAGVIGLDLAKQISAGGLVAWVVR